MHQLSLWLNWLLGGLAALVLFLMMLLTFVDVISRYVFNSPIPGAFEITEMMMATLIFAGLPLVSARMEHITIDLFDPLVPQMLRGLRDALISLMGAVMIGALSWRMWIKAEETREYGDRTAALHIPIAPMTYFMFTMTSLTCVILLFLAAVQLAGYRPRAS
jgi:TRAP-type C4-dicarboxylate transport system permease small subunit